MRIALAQINPTVGDFDGNLRRIEASLSRAEQRGADLCVLPEMTIIGYPPQDLLERSRFVGDNLEYLEQLAKKTTNIAAIVGYVRPSPKTVGKSLENVAALIADGEIVSTHAKTLLPTYDVFDERRYFEPGDAVRAIDYMGTRLGISICEDIWNTADVGNGRGYDYDPIADLVKQGAEVIINISASPFTFEKRKTRKEMLEAVAKRHSRPVVFVNQVGGNDELVFDGHSIAIDSDGTTMARAHEFAEDLVIVDLESGEGDIHDVCSSNEAAVIDALTLGTRDYVEKCGFGSVVIGLSGGIDSAMVATVAARAMGPSNVTGVSMPSRYSSQGSLDDAAELARNLGIKYQVLPIDDLFQAFLDSLSPVFEGLEQDVTEENIQARVRGVLLMGIANKFNSLVLSTGNKSESATGYATLYGDMAGGLAVISDVPKTLVYRLAEEINRDGEVIPRAIIEKPPSAELRPDQKDEDSLPAYTVLDPLLERLVDQGLSAETVISEGFDEKTVLMVARLVQLSEYKRRQAPPGIKVTSKAFGFGRRMPITNHWKG